MSFSRRAKKDEVRVTNFPETQISQAVTGTFFQNIQPVSVASLPLPSGAAIEAGNLADIKSNTDHLDIDASTLRDAITGVGAAARTLADIVAALQGSIAVTGVFYPETQPVSAVSLPLPAGASTAALQSTLNDLVTMLNTLIETQSELVSRLNVLASWASSGAPGMRVIGVSMPSTAVTGPITQAQMDTEQLWRNNLLAEKANISNATGGA